MLYIVVGFLSLVLTDLDLLHFFSSSVLVFRGRLGLAVWVRHLDGI